MTRAITRTVPSGQCLTTEPLPKFPLPAAGLQWCIILYAFLHGLLDGKIVGPTLDVAALFQGDFGVAAVLISFGALLGKVSPTQLLWLCMLELVFYAISEALISEVRPIACTAPAREAQGPRMKEGLNYILPRPMHSGPARRRRRGKHRHPHLWCVEVLDRPPLPCL